MLDTITVLGLPSVNANSVAVLVGLHTCPFPASKMLCINSLHVCCAYPMSLLSLMFGSHVNHGNQRLEVCEAGTLTAKITFYADAGDWHHK